MQHYYIILPSDAVDVPLTIGERSLDCDLEIIDTLDFTKECVRKKDVLEVMKSGIKFINLSTYNTIIPIVDSCFNYKSGIKFINLSTYNTIIPTVDSCFDYKYGQISLENAASGLNLSIVFNSRKFILTRFLNTESFLIAEEGKGIKALSADYIRNIDLIPTYLDIVNNGLYFIICEYLSVQITEKGVSFNGNYLYNGDLDNALRSQIRDIGMKGVSSNDALNLLLDFKRLVEFCPIKKDIGDMWLTFILANINSEDTKYIRDDVIRLVDRFCSKDVKVRIAKKLFLGKE